MARHRKPTGILDLTGRLANNPGRYADRAHEPRNNNAVGDPPAHLLPNERAMWIELSGNLVRGVALASDRMTFELLVEYATRIRERKATASDKKEFRLLSSLYGMTPADRSRVSAEPGEAANDFDDEQTG